MTVLALKTAPPRQRGVVAARPGLARDVDAASIPAPPTIACRSATSPTACTCQTWLAPQMRQVYDRHLGPDWPQRAASPGFWEAIDDVDDGELWETHQTLKVQLIEIARRRAAPQAERRGESAEFVAQMRRALSLDALTIGFARRFATYKRANLMLQRHRGDRRARQRPADADPVRLRRQVASARLAGQGRAAARSRG